MTIRVLHVIKGLGPGGAEQLLVNQAHAGATGPSSSGVAYLVSWKNHNVPALEAAGWSTICLRSDRAWDLRFVPRLRRLLAGGSYDVVHGHSPLVAAITRLLLRTIPRSKRPASVYTEHNEWGRHKIATRWMNRCTVGLEDHVLAVSDGVRASMPPGLDVEVLIHGIDLDAVASQRSHRHEVRAELGIEDDEVAIGTVANFRREKAYEVMLEAAVSVADTLPHVRFVSVGQGPLEVEIRADHERLDLGDRFLLLGYRDDATRVMSAFDIFTLSSRHEGLPVSLMDAMALGLPVVATDVGGISAAVQGWPSILVAPDDPAALAEAYRTMIGRLPVDPPAEGAAQFDARVAAGELTTIYRTVAAMSDPSTGGA